MQVGGNPVNKVFREYITSDGPVVQTDQTEYRHHVQSTNFRHGALSGVVKPVSKHGSTYYQIACNLSGMSNGMVHYIASTPPTRGYSYSGSALPYPNPEVAYSESQSRGTAVVDADGDFIIEIEQPNSYYVRQGTVLLEPHIHIYDQKEGQLYKIALGQSVSNRSLTGLPGRPDRSARR